MISLEFIKDYASLLIFLVSFILVYAALIKFQVPGTKIVLAILSFLVSLVLVSSQKSVSYLFDLLPSMTIILIISLFILLLFTFTGKGEDFKKILAWAGFILAAIILIYMAISHFPTINHMLPNTNNSGLNSSVSEFKGWLYSREVLETILFIVVVAVVGFLMTK